MIAQTGAYTLKQYCGAAIRASRSIWPTEMSVSGLSTSYTIILVATAVGGVLSGLGLLLRRHDW
jgi:hypothetical protein